MASMRSAYVDDDSASRCSWIQRKTCELVRFSFITLLTYERATSTPNSRFHYTMMHSVQSKSDLLDRLHQQGDDLRRLGVKRLGIFGSFQRDATTEESDVDVLVEFAPGQKSFDHFMELSFLLEDELGRPVELVTPEALSPHIGPRILSEVEYVSISD